MYVSIYLSLYIYIYIHTYTHSYNIDLPARFGDVVSMSNCLDYHNSRSLNSNVYEIMIHTGALTACLKAAMKDLEVDNLLS